MSRHAIVVGAGIGGLTAAVALRRRGWDVRTFWNRDAHNWTAWRDSLHPHLAELLLRAWT